MSICNLCKKDIHKNSLVWKRKSDPKSNLFDLKICDDCKNKEA